MDGCRVHCKASSRNDRIKVCPDIRVTDEIQVSSEVPACVVPSPEVDASLAATLTESYRA